MGIEFTTFGELSHYDRFIYDSLEYVKKTDWEVGPDEPNAYDTVDFDGWVFDDEDQVIKVGAKANGASDSVDRDRQEETPDQGTTGSDRDPVSALPA